VNEPTTVLAHCAVAGRRGPQSRRACIERKAIALVSNHERAPLDPPSNAWLGHGCDRERIRSSGLWNWRHVDEQHDPASLDELESLMTGTQAQRIIDLLARSPGLDDHEIGNALDPRRGAAVDSGR
jgi:hypothetical protein